MPTLVMTVLDFTAEDQQAHLAALANVRAQLHSLLDLSCEVSKGIELAKTCVGGIRVARGAFEYLAQRGDTGHLSRMLPPGVQVPATALSVAAQKGADQLKAGLAAQLHVNAVAESAADALAALQINLQLLASNAMPSQVTAVAEIQRRAADVVATCKGWVRLTAVTAHLLRLECSRLHNRLAEHVHCERLTAETLCNARQGARAKN